jgi:pyruvate dehydrogenase E2 component (dihydrolipoamide acetyltransferase)
LSARSFALLAGCAGRPKFGERLVPIEVNLAKLSPTMESGQLVKWLVKVGDKVKEGDTLAEVQTDKAVMPMEAFEEGTVALIDVAEGQDLALGQRVLVLATKGEDPKAVAASSKARVPAGQATPSGEPSRAPAHEAALAAGNGQGPQPAATPPAEPVAAHAESSTGRVKSTPLARKIAAEAGVDLARVPGSGPGGRVVRADVEAAANQKPRVAPVRAPAAHPTAPERIPHTPMRKTIAARMIQSKQSVAEIHLTVDIRIDELAAVRERLNRQLAAEQIKLSVSDFVTKAVAMSLRRHPALNASFEPDAIVRHADVNVGIAVALENGLIVPVLRGADALGLREIRLGTEAIVDAARKSKLTSSMMTGGTFTISNLGMYGVREFDAIINSPEVGILAVGAAEKRPVVVGDQLAVGTVMTVTLTADHRAVDGATGAEFLRTLKELLEEPAAMLL